ncbi:hypothetical protein WA158_008360 [Blastocystis sp. Blastoise]
MSSEKQTEKDRTINTVDPKESCQAMLQQLNGDLQITPTLKTALSRGWSDTLLTTLDQYIKEKDQSIHEICDKNYLQFGSSLDGVSSIKHDLESLKSDIEGFHEEIGSSAEKTLGVAEQYLSYRCLQDHIDDASKSIDIFDNLITIAEKAQRQLSENKYFPALKTIYTLRSYLKDIPNCRLSRNIQAFIQPQIDRVIDAVNDSFVEWTEKIAIVSTPVGKTLFQKTCEKMNDIGTLDSNNNGNKESVGASLDELIESIDISTVYQCLHVYEYMNKMDDFVYLYKEKRLEQANFETMADHSLTSMDTTLFLSLLQDLLERSISFFVVEETIQRGPQPIISNQELKALFDRNLKALIEAIDYHLKKISGLDELITIESALWTYGLCMSQPPYSMNVTSIFDLKNNLFELAVHNIQKQACYDIDAVVSREDFGNYSCKDQKDYEENIYRYGLIQELPQGDFPISMDFTSVVPNCLYIIFNNLTILMKFAKAVNIYDINRELFDLCKNLFHHVKEVTDPSENVNELQPLQLGYHSLNSGYFSTAAKHFQNIILTMTGTKKENLPTGEQAADYNLDGISREFMQVQGKLQGTLFEQIGNKSDELLAEYSTINFLETTPNNKPHSNITALINYLEVIFSLLDILPSSIRDAAHFTTFKNISDKISELLYDEDFPINCVDLFNLNLDLSSLETFAEKCDIPDLIEIFRSLRQLLDYLLSDNLRSVLNSDARATQLSRLTLSNIYSVLKRCKELKKTQINKKNSMIPNLKKKDVEFILKQIEPLLDADM